MWSRIDLKNHAKFILNRSYWKCVLVSLILTVITGGATGFSTGISTGRNSANYFNDYSYNGSYNYYRYNSFYESSVLLAFLAFFFFIFIAIMLSQIVIGIFVYNPLVVGSQKFFIENRKGPASLKEIVFAFSKYYKNVILVEFLRFIFTFLWGLLFVIPGIIKSYEYRMIPYLIAEYPEMKHETAFSLSKQMMDGEKWNVFVLDLSFIGWNILSGFTCGLLGIFYVNPYYHLTCAELYALLKQRIDFSQIQM